MFSVRRRVSACRVGQSALALACLVLVLTAYAASKADDSGVKTFDLKPLDGATIRETVPVIVPRAAYPDTGYLTITVDGNFVEATAFPDEGNVVYEWDTKAPYTLPNDPDKKLYLVDGDHTITVTLYNRDNSVAAAATSKVRINNTIAELKDGVKLIYQWGKAQDSFYHRVSELDEVDPNLGVPPTPIQKADIQFRRTVEDSDGGDYLIRDAVLDTGIITTSGTPTYVKTAYSIKGRMRTVNVSGVTVSNNLPINASGNHFGFPIAAFPGRRIQVGDSWEAPIETSLQWACEHPTVLRGNGRLDSFEWENGYPCAKIIETYTGPATFNIDGVSPVDGANVDLTRTIWFAYTSGRLIHISTDEKVDATMTSSQVAALGGSTAPQQAPAQVAGGVNPFTPGPGPNPGGNMGQLPGPSTDSGESKAQVTFHVTEDISPILH